MDKHIDKFLGCCFTSSLFFGEISALCNLESLPPLFPPLLLISPFKGVLNGSNFKILFQEPLIVETDGEIEHCDRKSDETKR